MVRGEERGVMVRGGEGCDGEGEERDVMVKREGEDGRGVMVKGREGMGMTVRGREV